MLTLRHLDPDRMLAAAANLCAADLAELRAAGIDDALTMLQHALPECLWVQEATWEGETVAIFGVRPMQDAGVPWMLTTTAMDRAGHAAVALAARRAVRRMQREFPRLLNMVHRRNERAIRFVQALGFHVHRDQPCGPGGEFFLFEWERACAIQ